MPVDCEPKTRNRQTAELVATALVTILAFAAGYTFPRATIVVPEHHVVRAGATFTWPAAELPAAGGRPDGPLPQGMRWDDGRLSWTPAPKHIGPHTATLRETRGGHTFIREFQFDVIPFDHPPRFVTLPATTFPTQGHYRSPILAEDPEGAPVHYRIVDPLPGMALDTAANPPILTWKPPFADPGNYPVTIEAWDACSVSTHRFAITAPELDWRETRTVIISNPGPALADHPVAVTVSRHPALRDDFGDMRFRTEDGTLCPHWVERHDAGEARVWVTPPELPDGESRITLQFGSPRARPGSDGKATFPFFDDFDDGYDTGKWLRNRDATDGGVGAFVKDGILHVFGGDWNAQGWVKSKQDLPNRIAVHCRIRLERSNDYARGGIGLIRRSQFNTVKSLFPGVTGVEFNHFTYPGKYPRNRQCFFILPEEEGVKLAPYWRDTWFDQTLVYDSRATDHNVRYHRRRDDEHQQIAHTAPATEEPLRLLIQPWAWFSEPNHRFYIDWIAVRPITDHQPEARLDHD